MDRACGRRRGRRVVTQIFFYTTHTHTHIYLTYTSHIPHTHTGNKSLALKFGAVLGAFGGKSHVVKALPFHMAPGEQTWLMRNTATGETFTYKWRVDDDGLSFAGVQTHYQVMRRERRSALTS